MQGEAYEDYTHVIALTWYFDAGMIGFANFLRSLPTKHSYVSVVEMQE